MKSNVSYGDPVNGSRPKITTIGRVRLSEPIERKITYETASWYTLVEVPAGAYDVVLYELTGSKSVLVKYAGTITDEHFVNRLFGSSSLAPKRNIGQERGATAQLYGYIAAESFATDPTWELAEDWRIGSVAGKYADDRPYTAYHLIRPNGERVS